MASDTENEVLLLTDQTGTYYAIPVGELSIYKVSDERKEEIEKLIGPDVEGYVLHPSARPAGIMWDPPQIFGGVAHKMSSANPSTIGQVEQEVFAMLTFIGTILNLASPAASGQNIVKNVE